ncbi:unnamed protein product [Ceratitis capitata]|uniref:(Mediterranean fruit fly) hypothetical protein n=1 Tax=Ceratitis capitata TaxID=7213 RepID=A0A811VGU5_CERCA|nr:unnamed protein product [Ceratitis capitata]
MICSEASKCPLVAMTNRMLTSLRRSYEERGQHFAANESVALVVAVASLLQQQAQQQEELENYNKIALSRV